MRGRERNGVVNTKRKIAKLKGRRLVPNEKCESTVDEYARNTIGESGMSHAESWEERNLCIRVLAASTQVSAKVRGQEQVEGKNVVARGEGI